MRSRQIMLGLIGMLVAGGICISATARAQASPSNACTYLTQAQVGAALGIPFEAGEERRGAGGVVNCAWRSTNKEILVGLEPSTELLFRKSLNSDFRMSAKPVSGIGDQAHFRESNVKMGTFYVILYVQKGNTVFDVNVTGRDIPVEQLRQMEAAVAHAVLANGL